MTHIEYDDFGEYTETIDLIPAGAQVHRRNSFQPDALPNAGRACVENTLGLRSESVFRKIDNPFAGASFQIQDHKNAGFPLRHS